MNLPAKTRAAFALFLLCVLAACGNKGPLVMPDDAKPADPPATAAPAGQPAAAEPAKTESGTPAR